MLKTYGLIFPNGDKYLSSVVLDEDGNPRIDTIRPYPVPENWVDPTLVELIKADPPGPETEWESYLEWFPDKVEVHWKPKGI
jgi:hypothetical protein